MTVPTWRARDVTREIDVVEEVARFRLDEVPFTLPLRRAHDGRAHPRAAPAAPRSRTRSSAPASARPTRRRSCPTDAEPNGIRLPEPMTEEQAVLRTTLLPSLVEAAQRNVGRRERAGRAVRDRPRLSARGRTLPDERVRVGGDRRGRLRAARRGPSRRSTRRCSAPAEFERAVEDPFLHPGKGARNAQTVGSASCIPALAEGAWGAFELELESLVGRAVGRSQYEDVDHASRRSSRTSRSRSPRTSRPASSSAAAREAPCPSCAR